MKAMDKVSQKHAEIREQNRKDMIGLYVYIAVVLLALLFAIFTS